MESVKRLNKCVMRVVEDVADFGEPNVDGDRVVNGVDIPGVPANALEGEVVNRTLGLLGTLWYLEGSDGDRTYKAMMGDKAYIFGASAPMADVQPLTLEEWQAWSALEALAEGSSVPLFSKNPAGVSLYDLWFDAEDNDTVADYEARIEAWIEDTTGLFALKGFAELTDKTEAPVVEALLKEASVSRPEVPAPPANAQKSEKVKFLNSVASYGVREWMTSVRSRMTPKQWKECEPFFKLSPEVRKHLFNMETRYQVLTVASGDVEVFDEVLQQMEVDPPKPEDLREAKSLQDWNKVDHLVSRIKSASQEREVFEDVSGNVRPGESGVFLSAYDKANPFAIVPDSGNNALYVTSIETMTTNFTAFVKSSPVLKSYAASVPSIPAVMGDLSDEDFDLFNDFIISIKDDDKSVSIIYNTSGGNLFDTRRNRTPNYYDLGGFARLVYSGKPKVFVLKHAYEYCPELRDEIDKAWKYQCEARKKGASVSVQEDLVVWSRAVYGVEFKGNTFRFPEPACKAMVKRDVDKLLNQLHHVNRSVIKMLSSDQAMLRDGFTRLNVLPSNDLPIKAFMDQLCKGSTMDVLSAYNYVTMGHIRSTDGFCRAQVSPGDNHGVNGKYTTRNYLSVADDGRVFFLDGRFEGRNLYMGGKEWADKVSPPAHAKARRPYVYADYEPVWGENMPEPASFPNPQDAIVDENKWRLKGGEYDIVFFICPYRRVQEFITSNVVVAMFPAPSPATMSVWLGVSSKPDYVRLGLRHLCGVMRLVLQLFINMQQHYIHGSYKIRDLYRWQMDPRKLVPSLFVPWVELHQSRYGQGPLAYSLRIDRLVRADGSIEKKAQVSDLVRVTSALSADFNAIFLNE